MLNTVPVLAVVGRKATGKTRVLEYIVSRLASSGIKIAVLKHVHHPNFTIDTPGKDTWKYGKAGARAVMVVGKEEIAVIRKIDASSYNLPELLGLLDRDNLDMICLEGFHSSVAKDRRIFKIVTAKDQDDLTATLNGTVPPILAVCGLISRKKSGFEGEIPVINIDVENNQLIRLIEQQFLKKS